MSDSYIFRGTVSNILILDDIELIEIRYMRWNMYNENQDYRKNPVPATDTWRFS